MEVIFYFLLCGYSASFYRPRTECEGKFCFTRVCLFIGGGAVNPVTCPAQGLPLDRIGVPPPIPFREVRGNPSPHFPQIGQGSHSDSRQNSRPPPFPRQDTPRQDMPRAARLLRSHCCVFTHQCERQNDWNCFLFSLEIFHSLLSNFLK